MSESDCQKQVIQWFRLQYPDRVIFAIPNGAWLSGDVARRAILMNKAKGEGLLPGVSDLFIAYPVLCFHGLFLEMKDVGKTWCHVTKHQRGFMERVRKDGYCASWAAGFEEAKEGIEDYFRKEI